MTTPAGPEEGREAGTVDARPLPPFRLQGECCWNDSYKAITSTLAVTSQCGPARKEDSHEPTVAPGGVVPRDRRRGQFTRRRHPRSDPRRRLGRRGLQEHRGAGQEE